MSGEMFGGSVQVGNAGWIKKAIFILIGVGLVGWLVWSNFVAPKKTSFQMVHPAVQELLVVYDANPAADKVLYRYSQPAEGPWMLLEVLRIDSAGNETPVPYDPVWLRRFDAALKSSQILALPQGIKSI